VSKRHAGHLRVVDSEHAEPTFTPREGLDPPVVDARGRPEPKRRIRAKVMPMVVRMLLIAWGGAISATLIDEFHSLPHLPFLTAMGMTGLVVVVALIVMKDGIPDWRGDPVQEKRPDSEEEDPAKDLLTQLPTFAFFQRRVEEAFVRARRMGKAFSVVLIDVNNLSAVNKEYGIRAGDEVLRHVARAVDGTRRYNDMVARLGDDEFGVVLLDCTEEGVKAFVDRLEDRLSRESAQADVNGRIISLWAGICTGAATSTPLMMESAAVLESAMEDLNKAKHDRERRRRMWLSA
jgi:diguanylate cyclase (GGDEF)-like protein